MTDWSILNPYTPNLTPVAQIDSRDRLRTPNGSLAINWPRLKTEAPEKLREAGQLAAANAKRYLILNQNSDQSNFDQKRLVHPFREGQFELARDKRLILGNPQDKLLALKLYDSEYVFLKEEIDVLKELRLKYQGIHFHFDNDGQEGNPDLVNIYYDVFGSDRLSSEQKRFLDAIAVCNTNDPILNIQYAIKYDDLERFKQGFATFEKLFDSKDLPSYPFTQEYLDYIFGYSYDQLQVSQKKQIFEDLFDRDLQDVPGSKVYKHSLEQGLIKAPEKKELRKSLSPRPQASLEELEAQKVIKQQNLISRLESNFSQYLAGEWTVNNLLSSLNYSSYGDTAENANQFLLTKTKEIFANPDFHIEDSKRKEFIETLFQEKSSTLGLLLNKLDDSEAQYLLSFIDTNKFELDNYDLGRLLGADNQNLQKLFDRFDSKALRLRLQEEDFFLRAIIENDVVALKKLIRLLGKNALIESLKTYDYFNSSQFDINLGFYLQNDFIEKHYGAESMADYSCDMFKIDNFDKEVLKTLLDEVDDPKLKNEILEKALITVVLTGIDTPKEDQVKLLDFIFKNINPDIAKNFLFSYNMIPLQNFLLKFDINLLQPVLNSSEQESLNRIYTTYKKLIPLLKFIHAIHDQEQELEPDDLSKIAFNISNLTEDFEEAKDFIQARMLWRKANTNKPFHDAFHDFSSPDSITWDKKAWLNRLKQQMLKENWTNEYDEKNDLSKVTNAVPSLIAHLNKEAQELGRPHPRNFSLISSEALFEMAKDFPYARAKEDPELNEAVKELPVRIPENDFNKALDVRTKLFDNYDEISAKDQIPLLDLAYADSTGDFYLKKLERKDPRSLLIGAYTGTCNHIAGATSEMAVAQTLSPNAGVYVVYKKADPESNIRDEIVAKVTVWKSVQGNYVLNSWEQKNSYRDNEDLTKFFINNLAKKLLETTDAQKIAIGHNYGSLKLKKLDVIQKPIDPKTKSKDSNVQYLVLEREEV